MPVPALLPFDETVSMLPGMPVPVDGLRIVVVMKAVV